MVGGIGPGSGQSAASQVVDTPVTTGGASAGGNLLSNQKDEKEAQDAPKFGDLWKQMQTKYGAKPAKPREIKKSLDKDDFLRIMVTQMQNQDPTSPFKAEQFAAELAQFTSVEQLHNLNQSVSKMANQNQPLERLAMTNLIGKTITVDRERFPHTEGTPQSLSYVLPKDAKEVKVTLISDQGETVFEEDIGAHKAGENSFEWDGKKQNTLPAKSGTYMFRIAAIDPDGGSIQIDTQSQARVVGVSFEGSEAVLLIGDPAKPDKVTMKNVSRIDADMFQPQQLPGARSLAAASSGASPGAPQSAPASQPVKGGNFFQFQKGVGSSNLDSSQIPPEMKEALQQYAQQQKAPAAKSAFPANPALLQEAGISSDTSEKGFPSGLGNSN